MDHSEKRSNAERLAALEKENEELRKQLSQVGGSEEDMYSYRIFVEARKKFLTWIGCRHIYHHCIWGGVSDQYHPNYKEQNRRKRRREYRCTDHTGL